MPRGVDATTVVIKPCHIGNSGLCGKVQDMSCQGEPFVSVLVPYDGVV